MSNLFVRRMFEVNLDLICDAMSGSDLLLSIFSQYCYESAKKFSSLNWGGLLRQVFMKVQNKHKKVEDINFYYCKVMGFYSHECA